MCGVGISDLPCLASGNNSNLNYEYMDDIRRQGISVNSHNVPAPENIPVPRKITLPKLEEDNRWRYEGIIFPRQSNNSHDTNAAFKNYYREEIMKMMKLELFLI